MIHGFKKKIKERCNYILPYLDKNNRLRIDKDYLEESIYRRGNFDKDFFKELYCGWINQINFIILHFLKINEVFPRHRYCKHK